MFLGVKLAWRRLSLLVLGVFLLSAIPLNTVLAQDPEATEQESTDRLIVAAVLICIMALYTAVFVGEDVDARGRDGFQWGTTLFILLVSGPLAIYAVWEGSNEDKLYIGTGIFAAAWVLSVAVYYLLLRPKRFKYF